MKPTIEAAFKNGPKVWAEPGVGSAETCLAKVPGAISDVFILFLLFQPRVEKDKILIFSTPSLKKVKAQKKSSQLAPDPNPNPNPQPQP